MSDIISTIVHITSPKKIILFGSYARKTMLAESDIDLMVIVADDVQDIRSLTAELHIAISRIIDVPCDVMVERETTFAERGSLPTLEQTIIKEGHTLYAA